MTATTVARCDSPEYCARVEETYGYGVRHLTVRKSSPAERKSIGAFWATGKPMKAQKYVVVDADTGGFLGAFGFGNGGDTRAEAVFWAERWASKNGGHFIRPAGWAGVVGALPEPSR